MSYRVRTIPNFDKALKRLAKKYPSLKIEFIALLDSLEKEPEQGTLLEITASKYGSPLHLRARGKVGETG